MELFEVSGIWVLAVGKTIVHSLWIGLLILATLRLFLAFIPSNYSGLRYSISVSALLLLFVSVLAAFLLLYDPLSPARESLILSENYGRERPASAGMLLQLFGYIYVAGVFFMLCRSIASIAYIRELRKSGEVLSSQWQHKLRQISLSLGISRAVYFLESTRVKAPLLVGYLKPAVILPAGMLTNLPLSQVETIILHELYHLLRRDYLVNIMQLFIEGVLFYHPVVWIISGLIRSEREHCCDDRVMKRTGNHIDYAKALIHLAEQKYYSRLSPGAVGSRKGQFESRIKRILNHNAMKTNMRDKILTLALLAGSLLLMLTVSGFSAGPSLVRLNHTAEFIFPDTIPKEEQESELEELEEIEWEAIEEEIEAAHQDALAAIEEIDWEHIKKEMEQDFSDLKIDWEEIKTDMELSFSDMKLDMEQIKIDIEHSMKEIDWEEIREDMREELENSRLFVDSIKIELDL